MPVETAIVIGAGVITLGATLGKFIFDTKKRGYEKKRGEIYAEIETYRSLIDDLDKYKDLRREQILKENFFILKYKILDEIDLMYKEKLKIKDEIEALLSKVKEELNNKSLNNFYRQETYRSYNLLRYGLEKVNAYFRYLNFYKRKISYFEKKQKYHLLFNLPKIEAFLPDEFLFIGKLLEVNDDEFNKKNLFGHKLILDSLDEKYLKEKNIVLIDKFDKERNAFIGSISKGELALFYKTGSFLKVKALETEFKQHIIHLKYKNCELIFHKNEKKHNRKIIKGEELQVRIKSSDYLLNNVFVTEKEEENNYILFVVGGKFDNVSIVDIDEKGIIFYSNKKIIKTEFKDNYAEIVSIEDGEILDSFEPFINVKFVTYGEFEVLKDLITKKEFQELKDYLLISFSARTSTNEFITKYVDLLNYQIENNQYQTFYKYYKIESIEDNEYVLSVNIDFDIEKNAYIEINDKIFVLKDYSKEKNFIKIDFLEEIPKEGVLIIYSYSYPYALIQQRAALNKFMFDQIVNKNIKNVFINPKLKKYSPIFNNLEIEFKNKNLTYNQKEIVKKALNEKDLFLIQGPPGTGKTTVIKEIIYQSKKLGLAKNILVVSQQNVAVDNVLIGLKNENIDTSLFRIASNEKKVYEELIDYMAEYKFKEYQELIFNNLQKQDTPIKMGYRRFWYELIKNKEFKELDESIKEFFIKNHNVIGATCVGLANEKMGLEFSEFDLVIIDEAGRATLGELLIPILKAKKVILIGDHKQLPPNTDRRLMEKIEKDEGFTKEDLKILEKSYFEELYENLDDSSKAMLNEQFRMPNKIGNLISEIFYEGKLKNGRDYEVEDALNWIDVKGIEKREGTSKFNEEEAKIIAKMVDKFRNKSIAIITPYSAQKRLLRKLIRGENIKIDTIDSFQGEEADIVFYSLVRNRGNIQFLLDMRRLNVAISRTREKLFFVGNKKFFLKSQLFREIIERI